MNELNTRNELDMPYQRELVESATRAAVGELVLAIGKFPTWPTRLTNHDPENVTGVKERLQKINDGKCYSETWLVSADTIIMEELAETLEAAQKGDLEAARKECIQVMAMLLRLYVHLPHYCGQANQEVCK